MKTVSACNGICSSTINKKHQKCRQTSLEFFAERTKWNCDLLFLLRWTLYSNIFVCIFPRIQNDSCTFTIRHIIKYFYKKLKKLKMIFSLSSSLILVCRQFIRVAWLWRLYINFFFFFLSSLPFIHFDCCFGLFYVFNVYVCWLYNRASAISNMQKLDFDRN